MKKLTTASFLVGGAIIASQSAFAGFANNDLYLGFQNSAGGGTEDYIINLGAASGIVGQSSVVDLSSDFSLSDFDAVLGSSTSMAGGVVGASNAQNPSDVFGTQLRTSNIGNWSIAGSSNPNTLGLTTAQDTTVAQNLSLLNAPAAGTGILDVSKSWESTVEPTLTAGSYYGSAGFNPDSAVGTSSVLYEDLWETSNSSSRGAQPFNYLGYFTLDLTGSNPSLTFTGVNAVPEPTVLGLLGGSSLLLLSFRGRFNGRNA